MTSCPKPTIQHSIQKGAHLEFKCNNCQEGVGFSVLDFHDGDCLIDCAECGQSYSFADESTWRQLQKFEALCRQIHDSEEILGTTSVGVDVGPHNVQIPYKLLLTRLTSELRLQMDDQEVRITFRLEPIVDAGSPQAIPSPS